MASRVNSRNGRRHGAFRCNVPFLVPGRGIRERKRTHLREGAVYADS